MIRLGVSVEGQTEHEFVTRVIAPHLYSFGIYASTSIIQTKRERDGTRYSGGSVSLDRTAGHIRPLRYSFDYVTTLYDFYGFRGRLPGETVEALESRLARIIGWDRFIPYIQRYEFESLLFGGEGLLPLSHESANASAEIVATLGHFGDPELINDSHETAPSRRIGQLFLAHFGINYDKTGQGPPWAERIGLPRLRRNCPRFGRWLGCLEQLRA